MLMDIALAGGGFLAAIVAAVVYRDIRKPVQPVWCCARYHGSGCAQAGTGATAEPEPGNPVAGERED